MKTLKIEKTPILLNLDVRLLLEVDNLCEKQEITRTRFIELAIRDFLQRLLDDSETLA